MTNVVRIFRNNIALTETDEKVSVRYRGEHIATFAKAGQGRAGLEGARHLLGELWNLSPTSPGYRFAGKTCFWDRVKA